MSSQGVVERIASSYTTKNAYVERHCVTPKNLYRYKLGKIVMTEIFIGIS